VLRCVRSGIALAAVAEGKAVTFSISVFLILRRIWPRLYRPHRRSSTGASFLIGAFHSVVLSKDRLRARWEHAMLKVSNGEYEVRSVSF